MSKKIELQEGKVYKFDAQRKGRFTGKVLAVRDEWVDMSVKLALEQYECAAVEPTTQGIIAKQAAAANVLGVIWRETRIAEAALAELEGRG